MPKKTKNTLQQNKALWNGEHQTITASTAIINPIGLIEITKKGERHKRTYNRSIDFNFEDIDLSTVRQISFNMYLSFYKEATKPINYNFDAWIRGFKKNDITYVHTLLDEDSGYSKVVIKFPTGIDSQYFFDDTNTLIRIETPGVLSSSIPGDHVTVDLLGTVYDTGVRRTGTTETIWTCVHREFHVFDAKLIDQEDEEKHLGEDIDLYRICFWYKKIKPIGNIIEESIKGKLNKATLEKNSNFHRFKKEDSKKSK